MQASVPELTKRTISMLGDGVDDHFGQDVFEDAGGAEAGAFVEGAVEGRQDVGVGVAADGGAPGADVVDVLVAINVPDVGAFDVIEDDGLTADGFEGPHGGADAARHEFLGSVENFF